MKCPRCGSLHVHRISPPWFGGKVMRVIAPGRRLQQCHTCDWRGYARWKRHRGWRPTAEELARWTPEPDGDPDLSALDSAVEAGELGEHPEKGQHG
jgi:hypothetical protein